MARRMRRAGGFRRRSQWRNQAWGYTPIGDVNDENQLFMCPTLLDPGNQHFFPVLTNEMFGPSTIPANVDVPFKQERVLCLRTMGHLDLYYTLNENDQLQSQARWVLALLDEEAVADATYSFPSLYLPSFHQSERVLLTGIAESVTGLAHVDQTPLGLHRDKCVIKWDQALKTKVETGSTLWLVIEMGICAEANPQPMMLAAYTLGYTRALWRD